MSGVTYRECPVCRKHVHRDEITRWKQQRACLRCVEKKLVQGFIDAHPKGRKVRSDKGKKQRPKTYNKTRTLTPEQVRELMRRPGAQFMEVG